MHRVAQALLALLVLSALGVILWQGGARALPQPADATGAAAGEPLDAGEPDGDPLLRAGDDAAATQGATGAAEPTNDAGGVLLDGTLAPPLPADAPKAVQFGVVLVSYRGAQRAPANARARDAALSLARELAALARTDFKAAVQRGDPGSMDNAGRIPRGMLEPAPEYVLFRLGKGEVSDPVDTPTGYWILHRIE